MRSEVRLNRLMTKARLPCENYSVERRLSVFQHSIKCHSRDDCLSVFLLSVFIASFNLYFIKSRSVKFRDKIFTVFCLINDLPVMVSRYFLWQ